MESTKTYALLFNEDYRGRYSYRFEEEESNNDNFESWYGTFSIPVADSKENRVFLVSCNNNTNNLDVHYVTKYCHNVLPELHSHLNNCQPFKVSGMTAGYKETGHYPAAIKVENPDILQLDPEDFTWNKPTVAIVVDSDGNILKHMSISPCA